MTYNDDGCLLYIGNMNAQRRDGFEAAITQRILLRIFLAKEILSDKFLTEKKRERERERELRTLISKQGLGKTLTESEGRRETWSVQYIVAAPAELVNLAEASS